MNNWTEIKKDLGSSLLIALERLWYKRGNLTPAEEVRLKQIHLIYPLGQRNFKAWVKQGLRQVFENAVTK